MEKPPPDRSPVQGTPAQAIVQRIMFGVFGAAFAGIGLTVIGFLWLTPFNQFGSPPVFFRVFGSFIALAFVGMGGGFVVGAILGGTALGPAQQLTQHRHTPASSGPANPTAIPSAQGYTCPNCGATLGAKADVSPLGDVKCTFCERWFNIHRAG